MKKTLPLIVLVAVIILAFVFLRGNETTEPTQTEEPTENAAMMEDTSMMKDDDHDDDHDHDEDDHEHEAMEDGETLGYAVASGGSVQYVAQKEFLGKDTQEVVGTTGDVTGNIQFNTETDTLSGSMTITPSFDSGQDHRDGIVRDMFGGDVTVAFTNIAVENRDNVSVEAGLEVTINGTTQTVPFTLEGSITDDTVTASGSGALSLAAFDLDAPSAAGVYTVDDSIGLLFSITANLQ